MYPKYCKEHDFSRSFRIYSAVLSLELSSVGWFAQPPEVALLLGPLHWKALHWSLLGTVMEMLGECIVCACQYCHFAVFRSFEEGRLLLLLFYTYFHFYYDCESDY